jgi:hypothetical protein
MIKLEGSLFPNHSTLKAKSNSNHIATFILVLLTLFIHPYIVTILASVMQTIIKINSRYFLPFYSLSLALFWSNRNYGFISDFFREDVISYMAQFENIRLESFQSLFTNFFSNPSGNEILYTLFVYFVGLFNTDRLFFAFSVYLLIAILISISAVLVDRRYYMIYIAILFFGIGSFLGLEVIHLWRQTIASLLFLIGLRLYATNKRNATFIMLSALFVHLAASLFFLIFIFSQSNIISYINKLKNKKIYFFVLIFTSLTILIVFWSSIIGPLSSLITIVFRKSFFDLYLQSQGLIEDDWIQQSFLQLSVLVSYYFLVLNRSKNKFDSKSEKYVITYFLFLSLTFVLFSRIYLSLGGMAGRIYQFYSPFTALMAFEVVGFIKRKYIIIPFLLCIFYIKFTTLTSSEFMQFAFEEFNSVNQGSLTHIRWLK